jgi:hypothetical protein
MPRYRRDSRSLSGGKTSPGNYPTRYASIHHICESGIERIHGTTAVRGEFTKGVHAERYLRRGIPWCGSGRPMPGYQRKSVRSKPILGLRPRGDLQRSGAARERPRQVVINLTTHEVIGPTNVGFCQPGPGGGGPIGGYGAIPAVVLTSLGLSPCRGASAAAGAPPPSSTSATAGGPTSVSAFAASWRAHEMLLAITTAGAGHLTYPDLTACPSCPESTAPAGRLDFTLTSVTNGVAAGRVTASSDVRNWALGLPVQVTLAAGSPGQLLEVKIGGKQLVAFSNGTSAGQCGA